MVVFCYLTNSNSKFCLKSISICCSILLQNLNHQFNISLTDTEVMGKICQKHIDTKMESVHTGFRFQSAFLQFFRQLRSMRHITCLTAEYFSIAFQWIWISYGTFWSFNHNSLWGGKHTDKLTETCHIQ